MELNQHCLRLKPAFVRTDPCVRGSVSVLAINTSMSCSYSLRMTRTSPVSELPPRTVLISRIPLKRWYGSSWRTRSLSARGPPTLSLAEPDSLEGGDISDITTRPWNEFWEVAESLRGCGPLSRYDAVPNRPTHFREVHKEMRGFFGFRGPSGPKTFDNLCTDSSSSLFSRSMWYNVGIAAPTVDSVCAFSNLMGSFDSPTARLPGMLTGKEGLPGRTQHIVISCTPFLCGGWV